MEMKDFSLTFPSQNCIEYPIRRNVSTSGQNVKIQDDRGQCIEFDRLEFGRIMQYALESGFIQILGADIDLRTIDRYESRYRR